MDPTILIADDAGFMRAVLRQIIEDMEWTVAGEAHDGTEAIAQYRKLQPDLVLLDITMPNLDGTEALKAILAEDPQAQVVMITALGQKDQVLNAIKAGSQGFHHQTLRPRPGRRNPDRNTRAPHPLPEAAPPYFNSTMTATPTNRQ